jgi:hypothetical protein
MQVILDTDLATLYQVETKVLKQAVRRNIERFPKDFMFELTINEYHSLRSQFVTLEKKKGAHSKYLAFAFTEQGVAMLSSVLRSQTAIQVNIQIMRVFASIRQFSLNNMELSQKIKELEATYNKQFQDIFEALDYLLKIEQLKTNETKRQKIGYQ